MYIIVQSGYPELIVDIEMIEDFSTRNCMNSVSGYYLNVIKACFEMIREAVWYFAGIQISVLIQSYSYL
jgi:hypothetical protein